MHLEIQRHLSQLLERARVRHASERFGGNDVYIRVSVYVFTRDLSTYARSVHVKVHTHVSRQLEHVQHRGGVR